MAFLFSELADFAVYQPLRERRWLAAVFASNLVGLVIDSALFLQIAFGSLDFIEGQIIGKVWTTIFAVLVLLGPTSLGDPPLQPAGRRANRAADRVAGTAGALVC